MAMTFNVEGPTKVQLSTITADEGVTSYTDLGYTDNADLISFETETFEQPLKTTRLGEIPEDFVHMGAVAHLNITLLKYDLAEAAKIMYAVPDGAAEGDMGTIGSLKIDTAGASNAFAIKIIGGSKTYEFHNCITTGRSVRVLDLGNRPKRLALSILCLPDNLAAAAGTDNIYTVT